MGEASIARVIGTMAPAMSTRKLIFAALLCGMAIIVAFTIQIVFQVHS